MRKIIELKNVTAYRGDTNVFDDFSLELIQGRNTAILGPNGAGKSTLLKLLTREIYPRPRADSMLRIFGHDRWNIWELREQLGIVSHDLQHSYTDAALGMSVILSGYYSSIDTWPHQVYTDAQKSRARRIAEQLGVTHLVDKSYAAMSTGEQRRFLLGRALVHDPATLVLDEPTGGLDLKACFQYLDLIRGLMRDGKTVVLVTHHIHEIPPEVTHVVLLERGRVMAQGEKRALLTRENLSRLYDVSVELVENDGFYQVLPG
jgi:iron complex transport system ATP-binding protein